MTERTTEVARNRIDPADGPAVVHPHRPCSPGVAVERDVGGVATAVIWARGRASENPGADTPRSAGLDAERPIHQSPAGSGRQTSPVVGGPPGRSR